METQNGRHTTRETGPNARIDQIVDRTPGREPWAQQPPHVSTLPASFEIFESTADGHRVIALRGELDLSNAAQLEGLLAGNTDTVLDLSELAFIDSSGLRVLISTAQRAQSEAWKFTVQHARPAVLRVIKLVGLEQRLGLESQPKPISHREENAPQAVPTRSVLHS